jgi:hypothetical protein
MPARRFAIILDGEILEKNGGGFKPGKKAGGTVKKFLKPHDGG